MERSVHKVVPDALVLFQMAAATAEPIDPPMAVHRVMREITKATSWWGTEAWDETWLAMTLALPPIPWGNVSEHRNEARMALQ